MEEKKRIDIDALAGERWFAKETSIIAVSYTHLEQS